MFPVPRRALAALALVLLFPVAGCNDTTVITGPDDGTNHPPSIVLRGPNELLEGVTVEVEAYGYDTPVPYVLVADPDGLSDVSAVLFNVREVRVRSAVAFTDTTPTATCSAFGHLPDAMVDLTPYLESDYPGIENYVMRHGGGYFYGAPARGSRLVPTDDGIYYGPNLASIFPDLDEGDVAIGPLVRSCVSSYDVWTIVGLYPPAAPEPVNAGVRDAEVDFVDVSVTVYDASGAHASVDFPDLHARYLRPGGFIRF